MLGRIVAELGNLIDHAARVKTNVWATVLMVHAGGLALTAHFTGDTNLFHFAEMIATSGATLYRHGDA